MLQRDATSNKTSAVINQVIGAIIGCILLFLALYLNFQDNQRDMSILSLLGYSQKEIRKMLVYIYRPIVWAAFMITLIPGILTARAVQKALSIAGLYAFWDSCKRNTAAVCLPECNLSDG